jgi:hypothetical protein
MIRLLLSNLGWKLFSLAVAVVLWTTFVSSPELVTTVSVPLAYQRIPRELDMIADTSERVHLEIQGPSARLQNFDLARMMVILDASGVHGPGERTFSVGQDDVHLPVGLKLLRAVPAQVRVQFERRVTKEVAVKVRQSSPPPAGYHVKRTVVDPPRLVVVGPESRVSNVDAAETDPVDLSRVVAEAEFRVSAFLPDPQVRFESTPHVKVRVYLERVEAAVR